MASTGFDQHNHQTQQSGKPVVVLWRFWLIYAVPDFPVRQGGVVSSPENQRVPDLITNL